MKKTIAIFMLMLLFLPVFASAQVEEKVVEDEIIYNNTPIYFFQRQITNFTYYGGKVQFLGGYMGQAGLNVYDMEGNLVRQYLDENNYTFHTFEVDVMGEYVFEPFQLQGGMSYFGKAKTLNVI